QTAIAISEAVNRDVQTVLPGVPIEVVRNAVDLERFCPGRVDGAALDVLAGLPSAPAGSVRVGLVATYARWKGQGVFLRAAPRLRKEGGGPLRFYVVGGPIYHTGAQFTPTELHALADALGLQGDVGFLPFRPEPTEVYRALDVVVHASTQPEPFG